MSNRCENQEESLVLRISTDSIPSSSFLSVTIWISSIKRKCGHTWITSQKEEFFISKKLYQENGLESLEEKFIELF